MSEKNVESNIHHTLRDRIYWCIVWGIVILCAYGNYRLTEYSVYIKMTGIIFLSILAIYLAYLTEKGRYIANLIVDAKNEIIKVVWPTKQEVIQMTFTVVIAVLLFGAILWGVDSFLGWSIKKIIG